MKRNLLPLLCVVLGAISISTARAQFSSDYQTNIISGVVSNWSSNNPLTGYTVGSNTSFDVLLIKNAGILSNSSQELIGALIGREVNSSNNSAIVTDSNSMWKCSSQLIVGYYGSGNTLIVTNGATVQSSSCFIAEQSVSSNNTVIVTGKGSTLECPINVNVGDNGPGNHLVISDGGAVTYGASVHDENAYSGNIGGFGSLCAHNSVVVTGTGSIWSSSANLGIGTAGTDNSLIVSNGGRVVNARALLGFALTSNNTVVVTGAGSLWQNDVLLRLSGGLNRLRIVDGGVVSANDVFLDGNSGLGANFIEIQGGKLDASNGTIYVSNTGAGETTVSNGVVLAHNLFVGYMNHAVGTLTINGGSITTWQMKVGISSGSTGRVFATGGNITCTSFVLVGGGDGAMVLSNSSASFTGGIALGGANAGCGTLTAVDSTLIVSDFSVGDYIGTGTVWITGGQLAATTNSTTYVGNIGSGQMICSNSVANLASLTVCASSYNFGTLTVSGGSLFARQIEVARGGSGTGTVWFCDGANVIATNDPSFVGKSGIGTLIISNSVVRLGDLGIGKFGLSDGCSTLTMVGGTLSLFGTLTTAQSMLAKAAIWLIDGQLIATNAPSLIGVAGTGQMNISNGAFLAQSITIAGTNSTLTLAGGKVSAGTMIVGPTNCVGTGTVTVSGGSLEVTNSSHDAVLEISSGTFTQTGGSVIVDKLVITNACGRFIHSGSSLLAGTLVLNPALDADGDGIPNGWEQSHGLDPLSPGDANADSDGDGQSNLAEFLASTDPMNSDSAFRITSIAQEGADIRVTWQTGIGKTNALQASALYNNSFADIFVVTNTTGTTTNYLDVGAATNTPSRLYRVRLVP